jgi:hypothetical protein
MPANSYQRDDIVLPAPLPNEVLYKLMALRWEGRATGGLLVLPRSPLRARCAVECFAYFLKREFSFDFPPYSAADPAESPKDFAVLWVDRKSTPVGACCFRWCRWETRGEAFALSWVWLHPYYRGKGHLSSCWPALRAHCDPLAIEPPVSAAMLAFLAKMGEEFDGQTVFLKPRRDVPAGG